LKKERQPLKANNFLQTVSILVSGKVQGVFFRKYTVKTATSLGISGFVKNTFDGNVYIEASGSIKNVQELIAWCHIGSPSAKVEKVIVNVLEAGEYNGFNIRY
jgi:acylphosphatase